MATTDPVKIVVEIIDRFSDELRELRAELERIDASSLNIDLDIQSMDEIASTEAQLDTMARDRTVDVDIDKDGLPFGVGGGGDRFNPTWSELVDVASPEDAWALRSMDDMPDTGGVAEGTPGGIGGRAFRRGGALDLGIPNTDFSFGRTDFFQRFDDVGDQGRRSLRSVSRALDRLRPNIMQVWNALAALIPIMVSLGAAAIGLAGAFIALGGAALAIVGVGLLGWGQSASDSLQQVQQDATQLARTLGEVLRPAATTFQPILQNWMEGTPRQIEQLVGPLQRLTVFADTIGSMGAGFVDWLDQVIMSMVSLEGTIEQIATRFARITGAFLIDWMENMVVFAYRNQEALIQLASTVRELFAILLEVSIVVSATLAAFSPLVDIVGVLADLLNTDLGRALVTAVGLMFMLETALGLAMVGIGALTTSLMAQASAMMTRYIPAVMATVQALGQMIAAQTALVGTLGGSLIAGGLLAGGLVAGGFALNHLVGGGPPPASGDTGSGGGTYINIEGDVGRREMDRLLDEVPSETQNEIEINEDMSQ